MKKRILALVLIVALYSAWAVTPVSAHALLLHSNPSPNQILSESPAQVELFFSEPPEPTLTTIKVFDAQGNEVDAGDTRIDQVDSTRVTVSLHRLSDGIYTVSWTAVSTIDGHQTTGSFPFGVGNVSVSNLPATQQGMTSPPLAILISKWLLLASLAVLTGLTSFLVIVWNPPLEAEEGRLSKDVRYPPVWRKVYQVGLIALLFSIVLGILGQAAQSSGTDLVWPWVPEVGRILTQTRLGAIWLIRMTLSLMLVWLALTPSAVWKRWTEFAIGLGLMLSVSLTAHAATEAYPLLPVLGDWLHVVGMAFWFGGLVYLFTGLRQLQHVNAKRRTRLTSLMMRRFSVMGVSSVAVIGLSGLYTAYLRVGTIPLLLSSLYGHVLLVKQIFVVGLLALAGTNLLIISPRLDRDRRKGAGNPGLVSHFGKMVIGEMSLAVLLLASVSLLTYVPPAKTVVAETSLNDSATVNDLRINIAITPGEVGQNTFTLTLRSNGQPVQTAKEVLLRFTPTQESMAPSELELIGQGDGMFSAKGVNLSLAGKWQVQAVVRRADKVDAYSNFYFPIHQPGAASQASATTRETGALILLDGLLCALLMFSLAGKPAMRYAVGILPTLALLVLGVYYVTRPVAVNTGLANPIPPNAQSIQAGRQTFGTYCTPCHGQDGKGDGPMAKSMNPPPADLTVHGVPGVHTDGQLFEWITNGFPGSRMPAFKSTLSDTDRWNLVNYVRVLAAKQQP